MSKEHTWMLLNRYHHFKNMNSFVWPKKDARLKQMDK